MKTTTTFLGQLLIILLLSFAAKGQILEYKELKEFHQDTIAYIEYTFATSNQFSPNAKFPLNPICLPEQPETASAFASYSSKTLKKSGHHFRQANPLGAYTAISQPYITTKYLPMSPSIKNCQNSRQIKSWTWIKLQRTY